MPTSETMAELESLVAALCELESRQGVTPVLVSDPRLVLADDFYVTLCRCAAQQSGRRVRLDLLPGHRLAVIDSVAGKIGRWFSQPWLPPPVASVLNILGRKRILRRLANRLPREARIEATVSVSRPGGPLRELVIGLAGSDDELPRFALAVWLGTKPSLPTVC